MWAYGVGAVCASLLRAMTDLPVGWLVTFGVGVGLVVLAAIQTWAPRLDTDPNAKIKSIRTGRAVIYEQKTASARWEIPHDLGYNPDVTVINSAGSVVEPDVRHFGDDLVVVEFSGAFSGRAYLH